MVGLQILTNAWKDQRNSFLQSTREAFYYSLSKVRFCTLCTLGTFFRVNIFQNISKERLKKMFNIITTFYFRQVITSILQSREDGGGGIIINELMIELLQIMSVSGTVGKNYTPIFSFFGKELPRSCFQ